MQTSRSSWRRCRCRHAFPLPAPPLTSPLPRATHADIAHQLALVQALADHWDAALPGRVMHVRYEDLIRDQVGGAAPCAAPPRFLFFLLNLLFCFL